MKMRAVILCVQFFSLHRPETFVTIVSLIPFKMTVGMGFRKVFATVATVSIFTRFSGAAANPRVEEQIPIVSSESQDVEDDSYWTRSPLYQRAESLMKESPLIDTHIDLPQIIRSLGRRIHGYPQPVRHETTTRPLNQTRFQIVIHSLFSPILRHTPQATSTSPASERATSAQPSGPSGRHAQTSWASTSVPTTTFPTMASVMLSRSSTSSTR